MTATKTTGDDLTRAVADTVTGVAALLARQASPIFAILDGARGAPARSLMRTSGLRFQSLYEGEAGEDLAPFGPYLVALPTDEAGLSPWLAEAWGKSFGVYLTCAEPFEAVRRHLRRFLMVELDTGRKVHFRFYDPRVLRVFLPPCTHDEWVQFFGPINAYVAESEDASAALLFRRDADDPHPERIALAL
jgi:hypothetical protein